MSIRAYILIHLGPILGVLLLVMIIEGSMGLQAQRANRQARKLSAREARAVFLVYIYIYTRYSVSIAL